jgi:hypothetical protein
MRIRHLVLALLVGFGAGCERSFEDEHTRAASSEEAPDVDTGSEPSPSLGITPELPRTNDDGEAAPPGACTGPAGRTIRTLIVGNSQIYFFDLPKILSDLSASAPPACPRIAAEGFTRGGQNLMRLWEGGDSEGRDLATTLRSGAYDVVVIAESIDLLELPHPYEQFVNYATTIIDAARAAGSRPILYATPYVDKPGHFGFVEMAEPQLALGAAESVAVATGGLAWLRVWAELPSVFLHHVDHSHPGPKGSVISAMVIYAVITGASPIGLTNDPPIACYRGMCPDSPVVTPEEAEVFQRAAWDEARARDVPH